MPDGAHLAQLRTGYGWACRGQGSEALAGFAERRGRYTSGAMLLTTVPVAPIFLISARITPTKIIAGVVVIVIILIILGFILYRRSGRAS
ncbi:MAG: hypothetical protein ACREQM_03870 [Candidatus Dormibacteraceae bacterium]